MYMIASNARIFLEKFLSDLDTCPGLGLQRNHHFGPGERVELSAREMKARDQTRLVFLLFTDRYHPLPLSPAAHLRIPI